MIKKLLFLLFTTVLVSGCMNSSTQLVIDKKGNVDITYKIVMEKTPDMKITEDEKWDEEKEDFEKKTGLKFEKYNDEKYVGAIGKKRIDNLKTDDWNTTLDSAIYDIKTKNEDEKIISVKKGLFTTSYVVDMEVMPKVKNFEEDSPTYDSSSNLDEQMNALIKNSFKFSYAIQIPKKAKKHNCENVDTKTNNYKWDLIPGEYVPIQLTFSVLNVLNILAFFFFLAVIIAIFVLKPVNEQHDPNEFN